MITKKPTKRVLQKESTKLKVVNKRRGVGLRPKGVSSLRFL